LKTKNIPKLKSIISSGQRSFCDPDLNKKYKAIDKLSKIKGIEAEDTLFELLDSNLCQNLTRSIVLNFADNPTTRRIKKLFLVLQESTGFLYGGAIFSLCEIYENKAYEFSLHDEIEFILMDTLLNERVKIASEELTAIAEALKDIHSEKIDAVLLSFLKWDKSALGYESILEIIAYRTTLITD